MLNGWKLEDWHAIENRPTEWVTTFAVTWKPIFDPKHLTFAAVLGALAVYSMLSGGRALIIGIAAAGLALWMGELARKAYPKR